MPYSPLVQPKRFDKRGVISTPFLGGGAKRPLCFDLDFDHPLAKGLVFAGLGNAPGSARYNDSSRRRGHGALNNMAPATDWVWSNELGRWCVKFLSTSSQYVDCGEVKQINGSVTGTIAGWMYRAATGTTAGFGKYLGTGRFGIIWYSNDTVYVLCSNGVGTETETSGQYLYSVSGWRHFAATFDGSLADHYLRLKLYISGVNRAWGTNPITSPTISTAIPNGFRLGMDSTGSARYWNGRVADPVVYDRVLTLPEIQILARRSDPFLGGLIRPPSSPHFTGVTLSDAYTLKAPAVHVGHGSGRPQNFTINQDHPLAKGLVFAGLGNGPGSSRYNDSSGKGNTGTLTNMAPASDWVWSRELQRWVQKFATSYGGTTYITSGATFTNPMTVSLWYRTTSEPNTYSIAGTMSASNTYGLEIVHIQPPKTLAINWRGAAAGATLTTNPVNDVWMHVAFTLNVRATQGFANGVLESTVSFGATPANHSYPWFWGCSNRAGIPSSYSGGSISDPLIYNRVLRPAEIQILANRSDPLLDGLIIPADNPPLPLAINDRHWVGRSPDWHSADNWSRSQGGRGGAGVPNERTNVFFD